MGTHTPLAPAPCLLPPLFIAPSVRCATRSGFTRARNTAPVSLVRGTQRVDVLHGEAMEEKAVGQRAAGRAGPLDALADDFGRGGDAEARGHDADVAVQRTCVVFDTDDGGVGQ